MKIGIVIVNYREDRKTNKLVSRFNSLKSCGRKIEVIVVDNNQNNVGFAAGANKGIKRAIAKGVEKVLLINPDVRIRNFEDLIRLGELSEIEGPVLKFKRNNEWVYDFGGKVNWVIGRTCHREKDRCTNSGLEDSCIDYISGAVMAIRSIVFEKIGLFDERFFLYFEDVDFCLRARAAGFKLAVNPLVVVEHQIAEHKFSKTNLKFALAWESNKKFIFKWIWPGFWPLAVGYLFLLKVKRSLRNKILAPKNQMAA